MEKRSILIVGDSFGTPTQSDFPTWYGLLSKTYNVTNLSQSGVGQYKIHQQLLSADLDSFDWVFIIATSPYRVHVTKNPFYSVEHATHSQCDLLYSDVESRLPDPAAEKITWWFQNILDLDHCKFTHSLLIQESLRYCGTHQKQVLVLNFFNPDLNQPGWLQLSKIWKKNLGNVNHLSPKGHVLVTDKINEILLDNTKHTS